MSNVPTANTSLEQWNRPLPQGHPAGAIQASDLILFACIIAGWVFMLVMLFGGDTDPGGDWGFDHPMFGREVRLAILLAVGGYCAAFVGLFALFRMRGYHPVAVGLNHSEIWVYWLAGPLWVLFSMIWRPFGALVVNQPGNDQLMKAGEAFSAAAREELWAYFCLLLVFVVLKPLAMHLVFRGWLLSWLRVRMNFWYAALISSLLFAGVQVSALDRVLEYSTWTVALFDALYYVAVGYVACALVELGRSLWPAAVFLLMGPILSLL